MATLEEYAFPAPPVCAARWTEAAWLRHARRCGFRKRRGPAPSIAHPFRPGWHVPFCGFDFVTGAPLYDFTRTFKGVF